MLDVLFWGLKASPLAWTRRSRDSKLQFLIKKDFNTFSAVFFPNFFSHQNPAVSGFTWNAGSGSRLIAEYAASMASCVTCLVFTGTQVKNFMFFANIFHLCFVVFSLSGLKPTTPLVPSLLGKTMSKRDNFLQQTFYILFRSPDNFHNNKRKKNSIFLSVLSRGYKNNKINSLASQSRGTHKRSMVNLTIAIWYIINKYKQGSRPLYWIISSIKGTVRPDWI